MRGCGDNNSGRKSVQPGGRHRFGRLGEGCGVPDMRIAPAAFPGLKFELGRESDGNIEEN